ncbi:UPF0148 protein [Methanolinea mesophila]|uniref:Sjogren's syndrome/scleroderma autoantigen 1 family protein n=1 Tax=Methanolinea mesophila TaxID=547055 RepID=UPI001AE51758|nr:Sjogren's syndrome/scleroderma autoantigen 1 family protein [Methanolinea mesophila]MBP1928178.1 UPF0148 protein [Methanolinea mesophila]
MTTDDEIMAQYLLKGGKMLAKTCQKCGSPLFEYKGETFCVVCRERGSTTEPGKGQPPAEAAPAGESRASSQPQVGAGALGPELEAALVSLCQRIRNEPDPDRVLVLMKAVRTGVSVLGMLSQR